MCGETNTMNLIESLQIDAPRMTSDNTCIAKMNLTEFHKQPQGYLNGVLH